MKKQMNKPQIVRYQISVTYRCNLKCKWCYMLSDELEWPDSDISLKDIRLGAELLKKHKIKLEWKLRLGGGEPSLHPKLKECTKEIIKHWGKVPVVMTNTTVPFYRDVKGGRRWSPPGKAKISVHYPPLASPFDLGIEATSGYDKPCSISTKCGRLFDCYGFTYCVMSGAHGRLLDIDPYSGTPVLLGKKEVCQHCVFSVNKKTRQNIKELVENKQIDYPTKTWKEGLEKFKDDPPKYLKFQERLK